MRRLPLQHPVPFPYPVQLRREARPESEEVLFCLGVHGRIRDMGKAPEISGRVEAAIFLQKGFERAIGRSLSVGHRLSCHVASFYPCACSNGGPEEPERLELPRFRGRVRAFDPSVHYLLRRRRLRAARRTARVSLQRFQFGAPPLAARRAERVTSTSRISLACATIRSRIHSATFGRRFATGCSRASASWRAPHSVSEKRRNAPCRRGCGIGGRPSRAMGF